MWKHKWVTIEQVISGNSLETTAKVSHLSCGTKSVFALPKEEITPTVPTLATSSLLHAKSWELVQLHGNAAERGQLSELSSAVVIYCLIKLISRSALKIWMSRHCLIKLISCSAAQLKESSGQWQLRAEAPSIHAHIHPGFPQSKKRTLPSLPWLGALWTYSHIPDATGQGWDVPGRKPVSSLGMACALRFF